MIHCLRFEVYGRDKAKGFAAKYVLKEASGFVVT